MVTDDEDWETFTSPEILAGCIVAVQEAEPHDTNRPVAAQFKSRRAAGLGWQPTHMIGPIPRNTPLKKKGKK